MARNLFSIMIATIIITTAISIVIIVTIMIHNFDKLVNLLFIFYSVLNLFSSISLHQHLFKIFSNLTSGTNGLTSFIIILLILGEVVLIT